MIELFIRHDGRRQKRASDYRLKAVSRFCLTLGIILGLFSCTVPGSNRKIPQVKLTIQNTLPLKRKNVPIVLTLDELRKVAPDFSFGAYQVVPGQGQNETPIHSQVDDTNYDGEKDELVFLIDLEPQETKAISIRYAPQYPMALTFNFTKRTRAGIFPELNGLAALESEQVAYLLKPNGSTQAYGKKGEFLFSLDSIFQSDLDYRNPLSPELQRAFETNKIQLSQNTTIEVQKPQNLWSIADQEKEQRYFIRKAEDKLNVYKAKGLSIDRLVQQTADQSETDDAIMTPLYPKSDLMGWGGFGLWNKTEGSFIAVPTHEEDYVRVIADGPVRSIVQQIIPNWQLGTDLDTNFVKLTATFSIYAGNRWLEYHIKLQGLPPDYQIVTGVGGFRNAGGKPEKDEENGWLSAWIEQLKIGIGVIFPPNQFDSVVDAETTLLMRLDEQGELVYRVFPIWSEGETGIQTKEEFDQYVELTATEIYTPPVIKMVNEQSEEEK